MPFKLHLHLILDEIAHALDHFELNISAYRTFHIALSFDIDQALRHRDQIGMLCQTLVRTWEK